MNDLNLFNYDFPPETIAAVGDRLNALKWLARRMTLGLRVAVRYTAPVGVPPFAPFAQEDEARANENAFNKKIRAIFDAIDWKRWTQTTHIRRESTDFVYWYDEGRTYYFEPTDATDPNDPELIDLIKLLEELYKADIWDDFERYFAVFINYGDK